MKKVISLVAFTSSILLADLGHTQVKKECVVERAVFELGSGVTTAAVATVNKCTNTVVKAQGQIQKPVPYQTYINTSIDRKTLPKKATKDGIAKIQEAKKEMNIDCSNIKCIGIATAAMRNAKNANVALEEIFKATGVKISVISQKEEGLVGYYSAIVKGGLSTKEQKTTMVLDIGGGSYQVVYPGHNEHVVYSGRIGSSIFRAMVIELVKGYSLHEINTPNPMTYDEVDDAKLLAVKSIGEPIKGVERIQNLLKNPNGKIYGIGSFLKAMARLSNKGKINDRNIETKISIDNVISTIKELSLKSDDYIAANYKNFPYPNESVTNLIFVYGIMKAMNIKTIPIIDTNNTLGIFTMPKYWP